MGITSQTFESLEALEPLAGTWDSLPIGRGVHADLFDSHAWLFAWMAAHGSKTGVALRIPSVLRDSRPVAILPLLMCSSRRYEAAGVGVRPRYRPIIGTEEPEDELFGLLVDEVAKAGVKDLTLLNLPSRDPATRALETALRRAGFDVLTRPGKRECLAPVEGDWNQHRRPLRNFEKNVSRSLNRAGHLGDVTLDCYGAGRRPILEGLKAYVDLHPYSWKGEVPESTVIRWEALMRRTDPLGWPRAYVLRIAGIPAAAIIFFCLGGVAIGYRNVYDQRMAVLSPGSILMWRAHEDLFDHVPLKLIDYLPGQGPQKDHFGRIEPRLLLLEAVRKTVVSPLTFPLQRQIRRVTRAVKNRRGEDRREERQRAVAKRSPARLLEVAGDRMGGVASPLKVDKPVEMFLAVAGEHPGIKAMTDQWKPGDSWWLIGHEPLALVRLGSEETVPRIVREIILLQGVRASLETVLGTLAGQVGASLSALLPDEKGSPDEPPIPVHQARLPWPADPPSSRKAGGNPSSSSARTRRAKKPAL